MSMRANVVLPAPRSPDSVTRSPGCRAAETSITSRRVACSFGSATVKLDPPDVVGSIPSSLSCRRALLFALDRECADHGRSATDRGVERHPTTMQLDEGTHER